MADWKVELLTERRIGELGFLEEKLKEIELKGWEVFAVLPYPGGVGSFVVISRLAE